MGRWFRNVNWVAIPGYELFYQGNLKFGERLTQAHFIGERIRDKIAASKQKGMWMGGAPPLGYQAQDRKLVIVESEAEIVRFIFRRYAELGSVRSLKDELDARSIQSKLRTSASGRISGGKPFARGALYLMLQNRIYRGEIVHKEQSYVGEHTPIIDQPLWDAVQAHLSARPGAMFSLPWLAGRLVSDHKTVIDLRKG